MTMLMVWDDTNKCSRMAEVDEQGRLKVVYGVGGAATGAIVVDSMGLQSDENGAIKVASA